MYLRSSNPCCSRVNCIFYWVNCSICNYYIVLLIYIFQILYVLAFFFFSVKLTSCVGFRLYIFFLTFFLLFFKNICFLEVNSKGAFENLLILMVSNLYSSRQFILLPEMYKGKDEAFLYFPLPHCC